MEKIYYKYSVPTELSRVMLEQPHILIGGTTGSGKSVLLNRFIVDAMHQGKMFIFVDLKKVELSHYRKIPHCKGYVDSPNHVEDAVDLALNTMDKRLSVMQKNGTKMSDANDLYLIFDEYADVKLNCPNPKSIERKLIRLVSMGRAARVHLILCTQRCTNEILSNSIKANFVCKIGLRTASAQESRNILGISGCEKLNIGCCYVISPNSLGSVVGYHVDYMTTDNIDREVRDCINVHNEHCPKKGLLAWLF